MAHHSETSWQHAYRVSSHERSTDEKAGRQAIWRKFRAFLSVLALPGAIALETVKDRLLELRVLNTHDVWPNVQQASTTGAAYLLNAHYWDVVTYSLMLASVPVFLWGFVELAEEADHG